jgi:hypothetical protein
MNPGNALKKLGRVDEGELDILESGSETENMIS